ncbi:hypothetical protein ADIWIN_2874 [Winogradskyella psychrotolerans RS-3]|uniref:Uncharacterized protein n=1 Tax=Winogradskyella psychrotolerans RS-3 TaxID=641526 RepID=S7VP57_9FLAO|nr:hypothetical protein [Winogradskyella psychrotolerans]EPR72035.1 hypothetical protein ADIWIN_2874 [Winogradskyella psychrotolerans RS-3]
MKNSLGFFGFIAIIFLTFGITYLDFDNLNFGYNYKAYAMLIIGILLFGFVLYGFKKSSKK